MSLTKSQRRQINRHNASRSTGPKSDEGKTRSRQNALKHGLRAEVLDLPNETPGACEALATEWHDYYQPDSPGETALIERAVHATIQLRRCAVFQAEATAKQVREATEAWDAAHADALAALDALLWGDDPATAVAGLKRSADGCALLLDEWLPLREALDHAGRWEPADRDRALRLCGQKPDSFEGGPLAYLVRYYNLFSLVNPNPELIAYLLDPKRIPAQLRGALAATHPNAAESRVALRELVELEIEALQSRLARLEVLADADRAGTADRAVLLGGVEGALLLRYEKMHDGIFHRAYSALLKGRKEREREEGESASLAVVAPVAPIEPKPAVAVPVAVVAPEPEPALEPDAPNEAKAAAVLALSDKDGRSSGDLDADCAELDGDLCGWSPLTSNAGEGAKLHAKVV